MILCHCAVVSDAVIRAAAAKDPRLGEVCRATGAGLACRGCVPALREIVDRIVCEGESFALLRTGKETHEAPEPSRRRAA